MNRFTPLRPAPKQVFGRCACGQPGTKRITRTNVKTGEKVYIYRCADHYDSFLKTVQGR